MSNIVPCLRRYLRVIRGILWIALSETQKTIHESHETLKDTAETRRQCRGTDPLIRIER